jgi:RNA polymerase sigma-70 factor (ECF subfamily)
MVGGHSADWEAIVREHGPMAFDTAWRLLGHSADTEDVVQEAFLAAFRLFRGQPIANWGGLLRHLATERAIDRLRSRTRRQFEVLGADRAAPPGDRPESVAVARELTERLRDAVAELPRREATVFSLRYFGEMPNAQIALTLEISVDAVGVALHKARTKLRQRLADDLETGGGTDDARDERE